MSCKPVGIIDSLLPNVDSILGIRDSIGAVIRPVYFLTRTWYTDSTFATQSSDISGVAKDVLVQMLPTPGIVDLSQNLKLMASGMVKNGDIILKDVSRNKFVESDLDGTSPAANIEKLFVVGVKVYQIINVTEQYVTWKISLRELTNQTRY